MTSPVELADYEWLTGDEADRELRDLAGRDEALHSVAARLRMRFSSARVHLLLEQSELRSRGLAKFDRAGDMFFTRIGLEQATDQWVAQYKARRFAGLATGGELADMCCGIGGDLLALGTIGSAVGLDRDPVAACLARANLRIVNGEERATLQIADIESVDAARFAAWHLDPDRRPRGKRTTALDWSSPSTEAIERLLARSPQAAVKLAPGCEAPPSWVERCELEWISRDRECRQLVAWHGSLAGEPGKRRATVLSPDGSSSASFVGAPNVELAHSSLERFLFEPDAAVLAAHLGGALAEAHQLSALSAGIAYLTGPQEIDSPLLACFAVDEVLPLDMRRIGDALRQRRIGRVEIKKRGVEHDPQRVRRELRLHGDEEATLVLTKLGGKHSAILARRSEIPAPVPALNSQR